MGQCEGRDLPGTWGQPDCQALRRAQRHRGAGVRMSQVPVALGARSLQTNKNTHLRSCWGMSATARRHRLLCLAPHRCFRVLEKGCKAGKAVREVGLEPGAPGSAEPSPTSPARAGPPAACPGTLVLPFAFHREGGGLCWPGIGAQPCASGAVPAFSRALPCLTMPSSSPFSFSLHNGPKRKEEAAPWDA